MVQSVNRRQSLEVVLTIVLTLAIVLNLNSFTQSVDNTSESLCLGDHVSLFVNQLASAADDVQVVSEQGVVPSLLATLTGGTVGASSNEQQGNIGDVIQLAGHWVIDLFSPTERTVTGQFATAVQGVKQMIPETMWYAGDGFSHLSRPVVVNLALDQEIVQQMMQVHSGLATILRVK